MTAAVVLSKFFIGQTEYPQGTVITDPTIIQLIRENSVYLSHVQITSGGGGGGISPAVPVAGAYFASTAEAQAGFRQDVVMSPALVSAAFLYFLQNLPTTMPSTVGSPWNNGGSIDIVQP